MSVTIPHSGPPELLATAAELADETARAERARAGQQLPRICTRYVSRRPS